MSGGGRYWNEDTQRWEDGDAAGNPAPATPPPPARPQHAPDAGSGGAGGEGTPAPDAPGPGGAGGGPAADPGASTADAAWWPTRVTEGGAQPAPQWWAGDGGASPFPPWPADNSAWPTPEMLPQPSAPAAPGGPSRRLVWSVVAGAAAVGVAVSLVLTLVVDSGNDGKNDRGAAASPSTSTVPTQHSDIPAPPSPTDASLSPTASPSALPAGYRSYADAEGFRIALPEGWKRSTVKSSYGIQVVNYRSPDRRHRLQVYQVAEPSPDASFQLYLSPDTAKPAGFRELALEQLDDGEFTGSRLEYLADTIRGEPDVGTWHVFDERFVAVDAKIYAIAVYGPDADGRDDELKLLTTALAWFCPPGATCDASGD
ncbi:hypothetical protein [Streptomyces sp. NPDC047009]|uniref:hypothetical protein n=1 Tax=Streptomyces sp. NPDC047009 TaxID=3154496 RepID=UPI0033DBD9EE